MQNVTQFWSAAKAPIFKSVFIIATIVRASKLMNNAVDMLAHMHTSPPPPQNYEYRLVIPRNAINDPTE